jgi:hypothetical protein
MKHGKFRRAAMAVGVSAAIAFGAFFSAGKALARKYTCSTKVYSRTTKKEARWRGRTLEAYLQQGKSTRVVRMPYSLFYAYRRKSDAELGSLIGSNLDKADNPDVPKKMRRGWDNFDCDTLASLQTKPPAPAPKPDKPGRRLIGDDSSGAVEHSTDAAKPSGRLITDDSTEKPAPEPKPAVKIIGKWHTVTKFLRKPALNGGKKYSSGNFLDMLRSNQSLIKSAFERVLKRNPDLAGKVLVRIDVGANGIPTKIKFNGKINSELAQMYANIFGRTRWTSKSVKFFLIQRAN